MTTIPHPDSSPADAWLAVARQLAEPSIELDSETFSIVLARFTAAVRAGVPFDPGFVALMSILERQLLDSPDDADSDYSDQWIDVEGMTRQRCEHPRYDEARAIYV